MTNESPSRDAARARSIADSSSGMPVSVAWSSSAALANSASWWRYNVRLSEAYSSAVNRISVKVKTATYHSVSRARSVLIATLRSPDDVPRSSDGVNQTRLARELDLLPKVIDIDINDVRQAIPMEVPDVLGDHRSRYNLSSVA